MTPSIAAEFDHLRALIPQHGQACETRVHVLALVAYRRLIRRSFEAWCMHALEPLGQRPARHHRLMIDELEKVASGETDRLMLLMPPGHAKSMYASRLFPAWWFQRLPRTTVIASSYGQDLADDFGRKVRDLVGMNGPALGYSLSGENRATSRWATTNGCEYFGVGVNGPVTGRRADLVIIDDPVKGMAEALSETVRNSTWDWYQANIYTRSKPDARFVLIQTRWHEDDLGGRLLNAQDEGADKWRVLRLPALADANDDPLGRAVDEALWPEWEDVEKLSRKRAAIGPRVWGSLFQQNPKPDGAAFFDVANVLVDGEPVDYPNRPDIIYALVDTATKTGRQHDGTAVSFWALTKGRGIPLVCLDWDISKIEGSLLETWLPSVFARVDQLAIETKSRMGSAGVYIEDKSSGTVLLQHAARRGWQAQPIDSKLTAMGKDERAISVMGHVSSQQVKLSRHAYEKVSQYNGRNGKHFMMQVFGFQIGVKDQQDDLLDTFTYSIAIGLGNNEGFA